jgi:hypothetical protein
MRPVPTGRAILTLIAIACGPALAGCGFSGNSSVSESTGSAGTALQFADCMRSHGVSQFPDPGSSAAPAFGPGSALKASPAFQSAESKCNKLVPGGGPSATAAPAASASDLHAALVWAQCLRKHGEPNFPDPSTSARTGLFVRGIVFPVGSDFDPQAPAFKQAQAACGFGPGGGKGPGGSRRPVGG